MSVESLSGLSYAAKMMGIEVDQVALAMERFDKQLIAAQLGNKKAAQNMSLLGIDPASIKTSDQALMLLAEHFSKMPDGILKTGEAMLAFGKAGAQMIPILNLGAKGVQEFLTEAKNMGVVITRDQAEAAEAWEQNMTRMKESLHGLWVVITNAAIPAMNDLQEHFRDTKSTGGWLKATAELANAFMSQGSAMRYLTDGAVDYAARGGDKMRKALIDASVAATDSKKAIESFQKSVEALIQKEEIATQTVGMSAAGVHLYTLGVEAAKVGDTAWASGKIELIRQLETQAKGLKQIEDFELRQGQRKIDLADRIALLKRETQQMQEQLDISMKQVLVPSPLLGTATQAFTDSITEQTAALEHQIATFGMTSAAITRYDLAMLNGGVDARKTIATFELMQNRLAGMQHAADMATKASQANAAAWRTFTYVADSGLNELIFSGKKFTDVLGDITKALAKMFLKMLLFRIFGGLFGNLFGGGIPALNFAGLSALGMISPLPTFAEGGSVSANIPILVGEKGPEIFTPGSSGVITPHGAAGGGSNTTVNYYIDARGSSITEEQFKRALAISENRAVQRALLTSREMQLRTA
jgi:hypothetical protein